MLCTQDGRPQDDLAAAEAACMAEGKDGAKHASKLLDEIEPGGAKGKVQLGYTLTLQLLTFYRYTFEGWKLDNEKIDSYLKIIDKIPRPVVIYVTGNHFDTKSQLARELAADPVNLLHFPDGAVLSTDYLGHSVIPFTLLTDPSIPVNRYRYEALRRITQRISQLPQGARKKVIAITLAGEVHQMFPDFENGMGAFQDVRTTDYSRRSQEGFRKWLKTEYKSVDYMSKKMGMHFSSFDAVEAPSRNIRNEIMTSFSQHYDGFSSGKIPFFGWLWDPKRKVDSVWLYIDGRAKARMATGMGRLDVYRAVEEITNANTGFRYDLDYTTLTPGKHKAEIIATIEGRTYSLGERDFVIGVPDQSAPKENESLPISGLSNKAELQNVRWWLDSPKALQDVYFNPLSLAWDRYREFQTRAFLDSFYRIARESGLPATILYSHQIKSDANATWNSQLFSVDSTISNTTPWRTGINLYGGITSSESMREFLKTRHIKNYGVPEFNPQQWKTKGVHLDALRFHYFQGARFLSPYYYTLVPQHLRSNAHKGFGQFELDAANPADGADQFDAAIREFVKE